MNTKSRKRDTKQQIQKEDERFWMRMKMASEGWCGPVSCWQSTSCSSSSPSCSSSRLRLWSTVSPHSSSSSQSELLKQELEIWILKLELMMDGVCPSRRESPSWVETEGGHLDSGSWWKGKEWEVGPVLSSREIDGVEWCHSVSHCLLSASLTSGHVCNLSIRKQWENC